MHLIGALPVFVPSPSLLLPRAIVVSPRGLILSLVLPQSIRKTHLPVGEVPGGGEAGASHPLRSALEQHVPTCEKHDGLQAGAP